MGDMESPPPLEYVGPCRECGGTGHVITDPGWSWGSPPQADLCRRCLGERIDVNVAFDAPSSADA